VKEKYIAILFDVTDQVERQENMRKLLELSQKQKSELEKKEHELLENMEELQTAANAMLEQEEALLKQINELKTALDSSKSKDAKALAADKSGWLCTLDASHGVVSAGERFAKWLGYLPGAFKNKDFKMFLHEEKQDGFEKALNEAITKGNKEWKCQLKNKNGQFQEGLLAITHTQSSSGHPIYFVMACPWTI
jgi:PAS domain-containing protein